MHEPFMGIAQGGTLVVAELNQLHVAQSGGIFRTPLDLLDPQTLDALVGPPDGVEILDHLIDIRLVHIALGHEVAFVQPLLEVVPNVR